jgi:hypothetical protein
LDALETDEIGLEIDGLTKKRASCEADRENSNGGPARIEAFPEDGN